MYWKSAGVSDKENLFIGGLMMLVTIRYCEKCDQVRHEMGEDTKEVCLGCGTNHLQRVIFEIPDYADHESRTY